MDLKYSIGTIVVYEAAKRRLLNNMNRSIRLSKYSHNVIYFE